MSLSQVILPIHLSILFCTFVCIFLADKQAFAWISGKTPILNEIKLKRYHYLVGTGLSLMILTGLFLFWPARNYLLMHLPFYIKMSFVIGLVINSFFIGKLMKTATTRTFTSLTFREKLPIMISGAVSTLCWIGAPITALFLFG